MSYTAERFSAISNPRGERSGAVDDDDSAPGGPRVAAEKFTRRGDNQFYKPLLVLVLSLPLLVVFLCSRARQSSLYFVSLSMQVSLLEKCFQIPSISNRVSGK